MFPPVLEIRALRMGISTLVAAQVLAVGVHLVTCSATQTALLASTLVQVVLVATLAALPGTQTNPVRSSVKFVGKSNIGGRKVGI